jgi:hypothetical protein
VATDIRVKCLNNSGSLAGLRVVEKIKHHGGCRAAPPWTAGRRKPAAIGLRALQGVLTALLAGAVLTRAFLVTDSSIVTPAVLLLVCGTLAWLRRDDVVTRRSAQSRPVRPSAQ